MQRRASDERAEGMRPGRALLALAAVVVGLATAVLLDLAPQGDPPAEPLAIATAPAPPSDPPAEAAPVLPVVEPDAPPSPVPVEPVYEAEAEPKPPEPESESARRFAEEFPAQAAAVQRDGDAATFGWAVIVGVNDYQGRTTDTFGSVPDALVLREVLLAAGWREDHILLLTDGDGDHDRIVRGLEWLARSTDERSTVVLSFSGHIRHRDGRTGLWPADNRFLWAEDFGRMVGAIDAGRMWITLQGCHAGGMAAPGVEGAGRVVTYSSPVTQKSYEDPETRHSLQGHYLFAEGLRDGWGDGDGDGRISVQEAFGWGAPRAETRSAGLQAPVLVDGLGEPFLLDVGSWRR